MMRRWIRALGRRLPARCEVCRAWPARPVCASCDRLFRAPCARCARCALPLPSADATTPEAGPMGPMGPTCPECARPGSTCLDACIAALPYAYPWDSLILRLKFQAEPGLAGVLAPLMRQAPGAQALLASADRLVPMPLGPGRLAQRGYNQAHELARRLDRRRADPHSLLRVRDTSPQSGLGRTERWLNVEGAFAVEPARARALRGQRVILVDDVMTTGASLQAAAWALRQAGARAVCALVLARTDD